MTDTKRCSACKEWRLVSAFGPNLGAKDGYKAACRVCESARHRAYYQRVLDKHGKRPRGVGRKPGPEWPLPTHDLLQSLACVQFRKWRGPVNHEPMRASL